MITVREYLDTPDKPPAVTWMHGVKLLQHILKGDTEQSFYKDTHPSRSAYQGLLDALKRPAPPEGLQAIFQRTLKRVTKVKEIRDVVGVGLDVEEYVSGGPKPFVNYAKEHKPRTAMTIVLDMNVPWHMREAHYMERRHKLIYQLCASARNENRAIRIIAANSVEYDETNPRVDLFLLMIKDYHEPLFENIWGALRTNATCNDLVNCIMDYLVGTRDMGNGRPVKANLDNYIHDQYILIDPIYFESKRPNTKIIRSAEKGW